MLIAVPIQMVPDLVEEISISEDGKTIDMTWTRLIVNEFDEHAIEQAILLKERHGGEVVLVAPDMGEVDDALFAAAAKGVDQLIKLKADFQHVNSHTYALCLSEIIKSMQPDLVLTGVQAHNDLDGQVGGLLAEYLGYPYVGYVAGVRKSNGSVVVKKEYPGGLVAEISVLLPAVLGIQAAESPPRYVAYSKIRQAAQSAQIAERPVALASVDGLEIERIYHPETGAGAQMLTGNAEEIAEGILAILKDAGVL